MHRLLLIRFALREIFIPGLAALAGIFLAVYLLVTGKGEYWHLPLIAGLIGTPLVAIGGGTAQEPPPAPDPPELPA